MNSQKALTHKGQEAHEVKIMLAGSHKWEMWMQMIMIKNKIV